VVELVDTLDLKSNGQ